jgi:hypothetical protein
MLYFKANINDKEEISLKKIKTSSLMEQIFHTKNTFILDQLLI